MKPYLILVLLLIHFHGKSQDFRVTPEGQEIMSIFFEGGSYGLDEIQKRAMLDWLSNKPNLHEFEILLHSHTDNIGSLSYNQYLSRMRSEIVIQSLEEILILREDIKVKDFGELDPLFDNQTLQGRLNNRRVDIILIPPSS